MKGIFCETPLSNFSNLRDLAKDELSKIKLTNEEEEWLNTTKDSSTSELIEKFTKTPEGKVKEAGENSSDKDSRSAEKHPQWLKVKSWWSRKMKERLKTARDHLYVFLTIVSGIMEKVLTGHYLIGWKVLMLVFTVRNIFCWRHIFIAKADEINVR